MCVDVLIHVSAMYMCIDVHACVYMSVFVYMCALCVCAHTCVCMHNPDANPVQLAFFIPTTVTEWNSREGHGIPESMCPAEERAVSHTPIRGIWWVHPNNL